MREKPQIATAKERDALAPHTRQSITIPGYEPQDASRSVSSKIKGLPKNWRRVALRSVAESIQYGYTASAIDRKEGPRFLRITDIQDGRVDWNAAPSCDIPAEDIPRYRLSSGDLVFARTGATTGKSFLIRDCPEAVFASYLIRVRALAEVDPRYLSAYFQSPDYWRQVESGKRGIGQPNVNGKTLSEIEIPLAPLDEQREIVAEIEKQFTRLEAGVAGLRRVQANLKRYRAAVLKAACEGKLVPTEAELARQEGRSYETGAQLLERILIERRQKWNGKGKYREPVKPDTATLPPLPEGWIWASLESITEALGGYAFESKKFCDSGFQILKMANVRMGRIDLSQRPSFISEVDQEVVNKYKLLDDDAVVTLTGSRKKEDYGYVALIKNAESLLLNQRIARLRCTGGILPAFLQIGLQSKDFRKRFFSYETGNVGQGNVGMTAITKESISVPPLAEQARVVAEVERRLSVVEELEAVVNANVQRATRLRQSISKRAFEGTLMP